MVNQWYIWKIGNNGKTFGLLMPFLALVIIEWVLVTSGGDGAEELEDEDNEWEKLWPNK